MTHFRKRLSDKMMREVNEILAMEAAKEAARGDDLTAMP